MHIHSTNPYSKLLRISYRSGGTVKKRTLANLSSWKDDSLAELQDVLVRRRGVANESARLELDRELLTLLAAHRWAHPSQPYQILTWLQNIRKETQR